MERNFTDSHSYVSTMINLVFPISAEGIELSVDS